MKRIRRLTVCAAVFLMALCFAPWAFAQDGTGGGGSFPLTAVDADGIVIEPCFIEYQEGDTIRDALRSCGHTFEDLDSDWIDTIDGYTDNYIRYYDGGSYDLDAPASDVQTALAFTIVEMGDPQNYLNLVSLLAQHRNLDEAVQKYSAVRKAYNAALTGLPSADQAKAKTLADNLTAAYDQYYAWAGQDKVSVVICPRQSDASVSAKVSLTDSMDNSFSDTGSECVFQLLPETYTFVIARDNDEVSGTFTVAEGDQEKTITPELPDGRWIKAVAVSDNDKIAAESETEGNTTTAYIQDTSYSPYINVSPDESINTSEYSVYSEHTSFALQKYYGDESVSANRIPWNSNTKRLVQAAPSGLEDAEVRLKVVHTDPASGFTQRQYHQLIMKKIPTLKGLTVKAGTNKLALLPSFSVRGSVYTVETIANALSVSGASYKYSSSDKYAACGRYSEGYSIVINGRMQPENGSVDVDISSVDSINVTVLGTNGLSSQCTINIERTDARKLEVTKPSSEVSVTLETQTGSMIEPVSETDSKAIFDVGPGTYKWITTVDEYYHACGNVTVTSSGTNTVYADGVLPQKEKLLNDIRTYSGMSAASLEFSEADGKSFDWEDHCYRFRFSDFTTSVYLMAEFDSGVIVTRGEYEMTNGEIKSAGPLTSSTRAQLTRFVSMGSGNNSVVITASKSAGDVTFYQDYVVSSQRAATIESMDVYDEADNQYTIFQNGDEEEAGFDADIINYSMQIGETAESVRIDAGFSCPDSSVEDIGEYTITINGTAFLKSRSEQIVSETVPLDVSKESEIIEITVSDENEQNAANIYRLHVEKVPPISVDFDITPSGSNVVVRDVISGKRVLPEEDGSFSLLKGFRYTYTVTAYGYRGIRQQFRATGSETIQVGLTKAAANNSIDGNIMAQWPYFRADENNNGVVDIDVPFKAEDTVLYWANKLGEGYSGNATGCPILADNCLYTYSGKDIIKVDPETGEVLARGEMVTGSSFAINSPTYAEGMIFVGLSNGGVQAFNAKTLESLWIYKDEMGGQPNCQITYKNGYIYTGFWNSETRGANFVCLSVTDEIPSQPNESKLPAWTHAGAGYYWAGAFASDDYVVIGTDDGKSGYTNGCGTLLSLNPETGAVIDAIDDQFTGDIRSSICYETTSNRCYFTTKDGLFCSVKISADGLFDRNSITKLQLYNSKGKKGMSTSTPVVYNSRAYVGVAGEGQFSQYTGHNITVIDLRGSKPTIAYTVETQGYPQTSGLLTTAYDGGDGTVYVYFFDNFTPGKLRIIKDRPGMEEADEETITTEYYSSSGTDHEVTTAATLFTPHGEQAQYAICSPIVDEWGNIFFKNDSAYMMKIGAKITALEVTKKPAKTEYIIGETFDPSGMQVMATYANGKRRDVTKYVNYTRDPLTEDDTEIDLIFDIGLNMKMYQNGEDGASGVACQVPQTSVNIKLKEKKDPVKLTKVTLSKTSFTYNGKTQRPLIKSINGSTNLKNGQDYTVTWAAKSVNAGSYKVTVKGIGNYTGTVTAAYSINKAANTIKTKLSAKSVRVKKKVSITATVKGNAKCSYKVTSGAKYAKIIKQKGKYYVKGIKKGTAVITVTAGSTANYKKTIKRIKIKVKK